MLVNLSPEAKIAVIISTVIGAFLVGPIVTGIVVLLAGSVTYSPWPVVVFVCTLLIVIWTWHILYGKFKSHFLLAVDIFAMFLILASLSPNPYVTDPRVAFNTAVTIYITAILMIVFHSLLALFVALGFNPRPQTELLNAKKAHAGD